MSSSTIESEQSFHMCLALYLSWIFYKKCFKNCPLRDCPLNPLYSNIGFTWGVIFEEEDNIRGLR